MGTLQNVSSQPAATMEPQHGIANGEKSSTTQHPVGGINILSSSKKLNDSFSSNCSSPDTPLDSSPFTVTDDKSSPKAASNDEVPESLPQPTNSTTESPSTQVMERPTNEPYRIPSSVFAKGKSRKETEWSLASSESLFSIQMGNMSFSREQFLLNSEELGELGEAYEARERDLSPVTSSSNKITELRRGELDAGETSMREFLRDSKDQNNEKCYVQERASRYSEDSSGRSFVFPILTGDLNKEASAKIVPEKKQPQSLPLPKQEKKSLMTMTPQAEQQVAAPRKWFSRFFCCSFCS